MIKNLLSRFKNDESGATAIEYGMIAAMIALVIVIAMGLFGDSLTAAFKGLADGIGSATYTAPAA